MKTPRAIDAFCGAGGMSIGLAKSGFAIKSGFDNDPICISTLKSNPKYIKHECLEANIQDMLKGHLLHETGLECGELDLLAGGPPCQAFSIQRTLDRHCDNRETLIMDFGGLILDFMPKFFLMENVPGIEGKRGKEIFLKFEIRMKSAGYFIHKQVLDAQFFGIAQRRRRLFVIGERASSAQLKFRWPQPRRTTSTVRATISHLPAPPQDGTPHESYPLHRADRLSERNRQRLLSLKDGQGRKDLPLHLLAPCHRNSGDVIGHRNVYGRMSWDSVAPTITARF
ncbi:MAG: DNA cytosine methyltransferase, partial [Gammaproteobacteria bacterium]|nr:DNA cytosine methyltransferase [Gammaproteobacteria bacterium]